MASPAVELRAVDIVVGREPLLQNISCTINSAEKFVLIGPSGHGKSQLLKVMAGLVKAARGEVLVEGQHLHALDAKKRQALLQKMGMLFQKNALFDSLTVFENVAFPMREVTNLSESEVVNRAKAYLHAVGLAEAASLYPDQLSGGMQKRLGIARALALNPDVIFYDDPTAGLDPITSRKIIDLILQLQRERQSTVIAVVNDMNRAYQLADRIAVVMDQQLVVTGTAEQTKAFPETKIQHFIAGIPEEDAL